MKLSGHEIEQIFFVVITANTPSYLLRRLRSNSSVQRVVREVSFVHLKSFTEKLFSEKFTTEEQVALAYVILGAASFFNKIQRDILLAYYGKNTIDWQAQLIEEMDKYSAPAFQVTATATPEPKTISKQTLQTTSLIFRSDHILSRIVDPIRLGNVNSSTKITDAST